MSNVTYQIREDILYDEKNQARVAFGIDLVSKEGEKQSFPDLFSDEKKAENLIALCNEGNLSRVHFLEVLEDFWERK